MTGLLIGAHCTASSGGCISLSWPIATCYARSAGSLAVLIKTTDERSSEPLDRRRGWCRAAAQDDVGAARSKAVLMQVARL